LRVDQLRGSTVEEPIDVYPRHDGWNGSCPKASNTDVSVSVDEDVGLGERECVTRVWVEERSYNL
jgi:hypothetical protein